MDTGKFVVSLTRFEPEARAHGTAETPETAPVFEFHVSAEVRAEHGLDTELFSLTGNVILAGIRAARELAAKFNARPGQKNYPEKAVSAGSLHAMGLIDEILHFLTGLYRARVSGLFEKALLRLEGSLGAGKTAFMLETFCDAFPPKQVYSGKMSAAEYLKGGEGGQSHRSMALEEMLLLALANMNPAFKPFLFMFDDAPLEAKTVYRQAMAELRVFLAESPPFGPDGMNLWDMLRAPALASPDSLEGQLRWMRENWGLVLSDYLTRLLTGLDVISEEQKTRWSGAPGPAEVYTYGYLQNEYENFTADLDW
ncbi:MAG: alpha-amylase, partial [Spirochaetaceae bacterium]|nr:alpha-amylase [Spirochaetaceae bacterium]